MAPKSDNVYGDVSSLSDVREINRQIRREMQGVKSRSELTELKKRSDYLCTLTYAPSWHTKFGDKTGRLREVAKEEDARTTRLANELAEKRKLGDADYDAWQGGD